MPKNDSNALGSLLIAGGIAAAASATFYLKQKKKQSPYSIPAPLLNSPYTKELQLAVKLALQCGNNMVAHCEDRGTVNANTHESSLQVEFKGSPQDFCTAIDLQNEELVVQAIQKHFSTHSIIGEETTGTGELPPLTDNFTWIIDPVDGTTNFASGLPLTCVSIGLAVNKKPVMGVVYAPMTHELYIAVRGHGAYRNGVLLDSTPTSTTSLQHAIIDYEFGYGRSTQAIHKMVHALENILKHECRATRCLGSGVLDICYVATGRLDVVYAGVAGEGWKPWDYCASLVIAVETGCCIESLIGNEGEELDLYSESVICAGNRKLLEKCRRVILEGL